MLEMELNLHGHQKKKKKKRKCKEESSRLEISPSSPLLFSNTSGDISPRKDEPSADETDDGRVKKKRSKAKRSPERLKNIFLTSEEQEGEGERSRKKKRKKRCKEELLEYGEVTLELPAREVIAEGRVKKSKKKRRAKVEEDGFSAGESVENDYVPTIKEEMVMYDGACLKAEEEGAKEEKRKRKIKKGHSQKEEVESAGVGGSAGPLLESSGVRNRGAKKGRQRGEGEISTAGRKVKISSSSADWDADMHRKVEELKEFIPDVEKRSCSDVYKLLKNDLPRLQEFKKQGVAFRRGRYTEQENEKLVQNVTDFLLLTGIDSGTKLFYPNRFPAERQQIIKLKSFHKFHLCIAAGIPRLWHDVYSRGRKIFDDLQKGKFSEEELNSMIRWQSLHGNKWMKIADLTGRSSSSLEKRFSQIASRKGVWSEEEEKTLVRVMRQYMTSQTEPGGTIIKREKLYSNVPWKDVCSKVETRNWIQCRAKWLAILKQKMTSGMEVYKGKKSLEAKIRLIKALYVMNVEDTADVNWEDLTCTIGDVPPAYVQAKFYKLKVTCVPNWHNMSFGDIIYFLHARTLPKLEERLAACRDRTEETVSEAAQQECFLLSEIFDSDEE